MTLEQAGLYIRMCAYIGDTTRRIPTDDRIAAKHMGVHTNAYRKVRDQLSVAGKIRLHSDGWGIPRAERELATALNACAVSLSKSGGQIDSNTGRETSQDTITDTPPVSPPVSPIDTGVVFSKNTNEINASLIEPDKSHKEEGVSETHAGHGVFVNCETIRHPAFTISLQAIRMGTQASGLTADEVKTHCVAHALQWAAEIEAGKLSGSVVPSKIANFLSASIMGATNRKAAADNRKRSVFAADDGSAARKRKLLDTARRIAAERDRETAHGRA